MTEASPSSSRWATVGVLGFLVLTNLWWYATRPGSGVVMPVAGLGMLIALAALGLGGAAQRLRATEPWVIALSAWALLALLWTTGRANHVHRFFDLGPTESALGPLRPFFFFAAASVLLRLVAPWGFARVALGRTPSELGAGRGSSDRRVWLAYGAVTVIALAAVAVASRQPAFVTAYPRCKPAIVDGTIQVHVLLVYWAAYFLVFASGEAFWRGYLLFGLERHLGTSAVLVQVVPYAIVHFGKPQLESLGAILAGLVLGWLALAHRSFWLGVVVHFTVAVAMDVAALGVRRVVLLW